jgi:hypothetical protein
MVTTLLIIAGILLELIVLVAGVFLTLKYFRKTSTSSDKIEVRVSGKSITSDVIRDGVKSALQEMEYEKEQEKIHDELVDNKTIFKTKEDIKRAFEKYNTFDRNGQMDLNALNYYVPKYVGEQNPNIRNLSPSLVKLKVQMKYGQENYKTVEVPLIESENIYEVKSDLIVRAQIVGGEGWVVLPKGTSIIMKNGKMDKIGVCRNDIHEVMCQAVRCNFEKGGKKISVMRMIGDGDNQEAVCREYLSQNRESIFKALTQ